MGTIERANVLIWISQVHQFVPVSLQIGVLQYSMCQVVPDVLSGAGKQLVLGDGGQETDNALGAVVVEAVYLCLVGQHRTEQHLGEL